MFCLDDNMFSNLTKNTLKDLELKKIFKICNFSYPKYDFGTKNAYAFTTIFIMKRSTNSRSLKNLAKNF